MLTEITNIAGTDMALTEMLIRLLIDIAALGVLVRLIYYPLHKQKDYLFTFSLFNLLVFITCLLLSSARIKLGFAFGLFAVFSMMRYRTIVIPIKEMGYFFVCIAMAIFNALVRNDDNYLLLIVANTLVLTTVLLLDRYITLNHESQKEVLYERIDLIKPAMQKEMLADLTERTGLPVHRAEVISIDFLHDTAVVHIYYHQKRD
jgi:hypothetical protein